MLWLSRCSVRLLGFQLFCLGCALLLLAAPACGKSCPQGFVEKNGQCVRDSEQPELDASTRENAVEGTADADAGARKPDASVAAGKPGAKSGGTSMPKAGSDGSDIDNNGDKHVAGGSGGAGAGGHSAGSGGSAGEPSMTEPEPPVKMRSCLVGATRCSQDQAAVEVCTVDDTWMMKESCPATCKDGACTGDCKPGDRHCGANQSIETCSAMAVWTPGESCAFVCSNGECGGECSPGSQQCGGADGLTVQTCDESGHWSDGRHCTNVCSSGSCTGSCMPGAQRCRTALTPEQCSAAGNWEAQPSCQYLCSDGQCTGECRPGSKVCKNQTPTVCDPSGHWAADLPCVNSACVNGVCGGACSPRDRRCGANQTPEQCSDTGQWQAERACQYVCSGAGECTGTCSPNSKVCSNNTLRTCRPDGSGYSDMVCQPAQTNETASCSGNRCTSTCASPGMKCGGSSLCWVLQYGCEQCVAPYVWREATPSDKACVTRDSNNRSQAENSNPSYPIQEVCPSPLVWREATPDDHRCVPVDIRSTVKQENADAASRTVVSTGRLP